MFSEDDLIQLSALQHFVYCPRQCALIHIEQVWVENMFTAEGRIMHDKVHEESVEYREGVKIERGMFLRSLELGLIGKADVVEFHRAAGGAWLPFPVEYKRGKPKKDSCDMVQLCAQALCLEEMLHVKIEKGALYYGRTRHRHEVIFDDDLRAVTRNTASRVRAFLEKGETPSPEYSPKCKACSMLGVCLPKVMGRQKSVTRYLEEQLKES